MRAVAILYTDGTLPVERTEPATAQAKHDQDEQWYARVNSECDCNKAQKCGDRYRSVVHKITAEGATSNAQLRNRLNTSIAEIRLCWRSDSKHYTELSATCDHVHMPRELLPRLGPNNTLTPNSWPYLSQSTINDVRALRYTRSSSSNKAYVTMSDTLQGRLQQHATTGAGTVAEAIVANDYWWTAQVAHEKPSGGISQAHKRRHRKAS
jgi:hypothetical protein